MGQDRLFVSGAFAPDDEVIITSTTPLKDGQLIRSRTVAAAKSDGDAGTDGTATKPAAPAGKKSAAPAF
jgi:hypothetical protein